MASKAAYYMKKLRKKRAERGQCSRCDHMPIKF